MRWGKVALALAEVNRARTRTLPRKLLRVCHLLQGTGRFKCPTDSKTLKASNLQIGGWDSGASSKVLSLLLALSLLWGSLTEAQGTYWSL